jgi:hypothetical protein
MDASLPIAAGEEYQRVRQHDRVTRGRADHPPTQEQERTMAYVHPELDWPEVDPPPIFATTEEIAIATELYRALERKYLGTKSPSLDDGLPPGTREGGDSVGQFSDRRGAC